MSMSMPLKDYKEIPGALRFKGQKYDDLIEAERLCWNYWTDTGMQTAGENLQIQREFDKVV